MISTERAGAPDIPPLYLYYRVEQDPNKIVFLGLSPAWSREETFFPAAFESEEDEDEHEEDDDDEGE